MIRTKHVLIFLLFVGIVLLALIAYLLATGTRNENGITYSDATFKEGEDELEVIVTRSGKDDAIRDSLIAKLGDAEGESAEEERAEEEETEEVLVTGGHLIGDGKVSTAPRIGYVYSCSAVSGGKSNAAPWIEGSFWYDSKKVSVDGAASWSGSVSLSEREGARVFSSNGLPNHVTGVFPISVNDDAHTFDKNSKAITIQDILLQLSVDPYIAPAPNCIPVGIIGMGLNGIPIYSGIDSTGMDAGAHEMHDSCGGHPSATGEYHYHTESDCLLNSYYEGGDSTLIGYARDGFGIFSSVEYGEKIENTDLDACHGHQHVVPWNGTSVNKYHYHMTDEFPYSLGCFVGTPVDVGRSSDIPAIIPTPPPTPTTTPTTTPQTEDTGDEEDDSTTTPAADTSS